MLIIYFPTHSNSLFNQFLTPVHCQFSCNSHFYFGKWNKRLYPLVTYIATNDRRLGSVKWIFDFWVMLLFTTANIKLIKLQTSLLYGCLLWTPGSPSTERNSTYLMIISNNLSSLFCNINLNGPKWATRDLFLFILMSLLPPTI